MQKYQTLAGIGAGNLHTTSTYLLKKEETEYIAVPCFLASIQFSPNTIKFPSCAALAMKLLRHVGYCIRFWLSTGFDLCQYLLCIPIRLEEDGSEEIQLCWGKDDL